MNPSPAPANSSGRQSRLVAGVVLDGAQLRKAEIHRDHRGSFTEVFKAAWGTCIRPVQWSVVESHPNVLRGLHLHRRHDEYFAVVQGKASVGLRDLRPGSRTRNQWSLYELSGDELACLTFPGGVLHGWYFHEFSLHLQAVSESHSDYCQDDNWGCHWGDPELEIPWPCQDPILSDRAARFPPLRELKSVVAAWRTDG